MTRPWPGENGVSLMQAKGGPHALHCGAMPLGPEVLLGLAAGRQTATSPKGLDSRQSGLVTMLPPCMDHHAAALAGKRVLAQGPVLVLSLRDACDLDLLDELTGQRRDQAGRSSVAGTPLTARSRRGPSFVARDGRTPAGVNGQAVGQLMAESEPLLPAQHVVGQAARGVNGGEEEGAWDPSCWGETARFYLPPDQTVGNDEEHRMLLAEVEALEDRLQSRPPTALALLQGNTYLDPTEKTHHLAPSSSSPFRTLTRRVRRVVSGKGPLTTAASKGSIVAGAVTATDTHGRLKRGGQRPVRTALAPEAPLPSSVGASDDGVTAVHSAAQVVAPHEDGSASRGTLSDAVQCGTRVQDVETAYPCASSPSPCTFAYWVPRVALTWCISGVPVGS
ncbi:hypothetical protein HaLaN_06514 [Haematococcus lacustris]|uniref:Uncharacterized protein n=1 Tax=Haematococcus lacustris TaxID=44745 RepID=A0A699YTP8_HAELA|nr:hypothetical protein HaLaN_06514 [Haematococcus lacustris]